FFIIRPTPPISTLFPYTTLFRSVSVGVDHAGLAVGEPARHREDLDLSVQPGDRVVRRLQIAVVRASDHLPVVVDVRRFAVTVVRDRKSTRLNSSHLGISYAVFCL